MKIEVWSDFSCPFCYIGVHNFYLAMDTLNEESNKNESLFFKAYELSADAPYETDQSYFDVLAQKYDVPLDRAKAMTDNAAKIAKEAGLTINFEKIIAVNTSVAHRLVGWTQLHQPEKTRALALRLFQAYFVNGENIADDKVLSSIMAEIGMQDISLGEILTSLDVSKALTIDQVEAQAYKIKSVPFFVINRADAIAGAQTPMKFFELLKQIDHANNETTTIN